MHPHDLLAAERFLAAEARIAACFERVEEAIAPLLRRMRATDRTTYVTDPERGVIWGHAFLKPPYAPSTEAEWFLGWGLRFPDGGAGWHGAAPPLPSTPHAVVAVGAAAPIGEAPGWRGVAPAGWSVLGGEAAFLAAAWPLGAWPAEPEAMAASLSGWTAARVEELGALLPRMAAGGSPAPGGD